MDAINASDILSAILGIDEHNKSINSAAIGNLRSISLKEAQSKLLDKARCSDQPCYTEEELFLENPPLTPGFGNIKLLYVKTLTGNIITLYDIHSNATLLYVKKWIHLKTNVPVDRQRLIYAGQQLDDGRTIFDYHLKNESIVHLVLRLRGGDDRMFSPPTQLLDPKYNYDFTKVMDVNQTFYRGGSIYCRPCGWMRFALKCDGTYPDKIWLDGKSPRPKQTSSADGEWLVSYHGTSQHNGLNIASEGYKLSRGKRFKFGKGIYSTPDIQVALLYAETFTTNDGVSYKVIIQNRVNPKTVIKISKAETGVGEYWITLTEDDIRPYGFCIRKH